MVSQQWRWIEERVFLLYITKTENDKSADPLRCAYASLSLKAIRILTIQATMLRYEGLGYFIMSRTWCLLTLKMLLTSVALMERVSHNIY